MYAPEDSWRLHRSCTWLVAWKWKQRIPPKHWYLAIRPDGSYTRRVIFNTILSLLLILVEQELGAQHLIAGATLLRVQRAAVVARIYSHSRPKGWTFVGNARFSYHIIILSRALLTTDGFWIGNRIYCTPSATMTEKIHASAQSTVHYITYWTSSQSAVSSPDLYCITYWTSSQSAVSSPDLYWSRTERLLSQRCLHRTSTASRTERLLSHRCLHRTSTTSRTERLLSQRCLHRTSTASRTERLLSQRCLHQTSGNSFQW
jgi:hypothetical protein